MANNSSIGYVDETTAAKAKETLANAPEIEALRAKIAERLKLLKSKTSATPTYGIGANFQLQNPALHPERVPLDTASGAAASAQFYDPSIRSRRKVRKLVDLTKPDVQEKEATRQNAKTADTAAAQYDNSVASGEALKEDKYAFATLREDKYSFAVLGSEQYHGFEWWDSLYVKFDMEGRKCRLNLTGIDNLVQIPVKVGFIERSNGTENDTFYLTKTEQKKLRRRKRQHNEREKQEKIQLGVLKPLPPKVKLKNIMRVLKDDAVANPSKVEQDVKHQIQERLTRHMHSNESRKLTEEQKKDKTVRKWSLKKGEMCHVLVFFVKSFSNKQILFKIKKNALQYHLTGCAIIAPNWYNVLVVEGGERSVKRFNTFIMRRLKWDGAQTSAVEKADDVNEEEQDSDDNDVNSTTKLHCKLVYKGTMDHPIFNIWRVFYCREREHAPTILEKKNARIYFDLIEKSAADYNFKIDAPI